MLATQRAFPFMEDNVKVKMRDEPNKLSWHYFQYKLQIQQATASEKAADLLDVQLRQCSKLDSARNTDSHTRSW